MLYAGVFMWCSRLYHRLVFACSNLSISISLFGNILTFSHISLFFCSFSLTLFLSTVFLPYVCSSYSGCYAVASLFFLFATSNVAKHTRIQTNHCCVAVSLSHIANVYCGREHSAHAHNVPVLYTAHHITQNSLNTISRWNIKLVWLYRCNELCGILYFVFTFLLGAHNFHIPIKLIWRFCHQFSHHESC